MSTKTIAVDVRVYERLAAAKREGESFSRAIERLLTTAGEQHTGSDIVHRLHDVPELSTEEADVYLRVVAEHRATERWDRSDLR